MKKITAFIFIFILTTIISSPTQIYAGGGRMDFYFVSDYHNQSTNTPATYPDKTIRFNIIAWEDSSRTKKSVGEHFDVKLMNQEIQDYCKMIQNVTDADGLAYGECSMHTTKQATVMLLELDKHTEGQIASFETEYNLPPSRSTTTTSTTAGIYLPTNTPIPPTWTPTPTQTPTPSPTPIITPLETPAVKLSPTPAVKPNVFQKFVSWFLHLFPAR